MYIYMAKRKSKSKSKIKTPSKHRGLLTAAEGVAVKGYDMGKQVGEIGFEMDLIIAKIMIVIGFVVILGSIIGSIILRESNILMFVLFGLCVVFIGFVSKKSTEVVKNNSAMKAVRGAQFAKDMFFPKK